MAAVSGAKTCHATLTGTTADTITLTSKVNQVAVINRDATDLVYVTVNTSTVSGADAATGVTTAVAAADETFFVPPANGRTVVHSNRRRLYVGLSVVGDGGAYSVHGTEWYD